LEWRYLSAKQRAKTRNGRTAIAASVDESPTAERLADSIAPAVLGSWPRWWKIHLAHFRATPIGIDGAGRMV